MTTFRVSLMDDLLLQIRWLVCSFDARRGGVFPVQGSASVPSLLCFPWFHHLGFSRSSRLRIIDLSQLLRHNSLDPEHLAIIGQHIRGTAKQWFISALIRRRSRCRILAARERY